MKTAGSGENATDIVDRGGTRTLETLETPKPLNGYAAGTRRPDLGGVQNLENRKTIFIYGDTLSPRDSFLL